jgi:hypothetical protein
MEKLYKKVGKRYVEVEPQRFPIDFFEFSFLVEACIPPRPIARSMYWHDVINTHYHTLTVNERVRLFEWINREYGMEEGIKNGNEDCLVFNARFDPSNQYLIHTNFGGENKITEAFKWQGKYHTAINTSINEEYITKIEKIGSNPKI